MTSSKPLPKYVLDCTTPYHSLKSYIYWPSPYLFGAVSQSCLECSLLGYSPHFTPNTCLVAQMLICLPCRRPWFDPWVRRILWRRKGQPTPVFLPGESHGQRSLAGYSPWGHKELDTTEQLSLSQLSCCAFLFFQLTQGCWEVIVKRNYLIKFFFSYLSCVYPWPAFGKNLLAQFSKNSSTWKGLVVGRIGRLGLINIYTHTHTINATYKIDS